MRRVWSAQVLSGLNEEGVECLSVEWPKCHRAWLVGI